MLLSYFCFSNSQLNINGILTLYPSTCTLMSLSQYHTTAMCYKLKTTGPSCSKLTTSLVNVSLKFQTLILQIHCYFLLKKCENPLHCKGFSHFFNRKNVRILCTAKDSHIFSTKSNSVFVTLDDICLTNLCLNDSKPDALRCCGQLTTPLSEAARPKA